MRPRVIRRLLSSLCLALACVAPTPTAHAQATYTIGVEALYFTPIASGVGGEYVGFARELLDAFAAHQGVAFEYKTYPVKRLYLMFFETGALDLKFPDNPYWNAHLREDAAISYSQPVVEYIDGVMVRPEHVGRGVEAIRTLGVIGGFTPWEYLDRIDTGTILVDDSSDKQPLLHKVLAGRLDGAYSNVDVGRHVLRAMGKPDALVFDPDLPHTRSHYHLSSIEHPELIEAFDAFLHEEAALVERLKDKHQVRLEY